LAVERATEETEARRFIEAWTCNTNNLDPFCNAIPDGATAVIDPYTVYEIYYAFGSAKLLVAQPNGAFASAPGHYPSGFRGLLTAKINGEAVETTFMIR
jgi:hypothetical protein